MSMSHDRRKVRNGRRRALLVLPATAAGLAALAACGSSGTGSSSGAGAGGAGSTPAPSTSAAVKASGLKTTKIGGATVLTNSKGFTLYSFAPDTPTKSNCNGACAAAWPPLKAPASASAVKAPFTVITRSDGSKQEVFNGHPLYTFTGDTAAGQANGNGVNAFGGLWKEITVSGTAPAAPSTGGGGY